MLKRIAFAAPLGVVIIVAAMAAGWWYFIREDAQLATDPQAIPESLQTSAMSTPVDEDASNTSAAPSGETAVGGLAFTVVSESSEAAYFADEELANIGVPSTAKGSTNAITGAFYLTADGWQLDETKASSFTVDLTGLTSDESRRDNRVKEALETGTYPIATFTVTSITGVDAALVAEDQQTFQMTGVLDLHGVQKEVTWEVEARREGNVITALATTNFLYADFNIPLLNIPGFVSVEDDVTLQMQIIAQAS